MGVINQITVDNTTYDVQDLISRPILTQAQYNALEEQGLVDADKDYHISDGQLASAPIDDNDVSPNKTWSSEKIAENDLEVYSTTEQVIGTWIDGKPIYRQVVEGTSPSSTSTNGTIGMIGTDKSIINMYGNIFLSGISKIPINFYIASGTWVGTFASQGNITMQVGHVNYTSKPVKVIIEYTKTTD